MMAIKRYFQLGESPENRFDLRALPLPTKIAGALFISMAIIFVALAVVIHQELYAAQTDAYLDSLSQLSAAEASRLVRQLNAEVAFLEGFAESETIQQGLLENRSSSALNPGEIVVQQNPTLVEELDEFLQIHEYIMSMALAGSDGTIVAMSPFPELAPADGRDQWLWFEQVMDTGQVFISGSARNDGLTGMVGVQIAVPVSETGNPDQTLGVLYVVIALDRFAYLADADAETLVVVYDENVDLLIPAVDSDGNDLGMGLMVLPVLSQVRQNHTGAAYYEAPRSQRKSWLYGYSEISGLALDDSTAGSLDWIVVATRTGNSVWIAIREITQVYRLAIGVSAAAVALCILVITFSLSWPLMKLAGAAEHIMKSETVTEAIPEYSGGDVGILSGALRRMVDRLSHQNEQLDVAVEISRESLGMDIDALLGKIARTMCEKTDYQSVGIYVAESGTQRARAVATWGTVSDGMVKPGDIVVAGKSSLVGRALAEKSEQRDPGTDVSVFAGSKAKPDEVVIPFMGEIGGAVQIVGDKPYSFTEGDLDIARLITNQIGFMLDNRYLLAETEAARDEAEKASRIKSQFLANMSHELRTPLNAILNFTGFVVDGDVGEINEEQSGLLTKVYQSGEHLLNLINDILDLSKIEADMMQFLIEDVDLGQVLTSTTSVARGLLKDKSVEFIADVDEGLPIIFGDKRRLRQVFLNIISNAIKFTPEGNVTLKAVKENGDIHISIADTGIGISPDAYGIVFEAFGQAKHDMEVSGTGLGMAISKHFIEAHGGQIWFESKIGVGTTFHVTLPVGAQTERPEVS